jgi:putative oxidoreductase
VNSKSLQILAFGLGILLFFHGVDKIMNGTEFIEKTLVAWNVPSAKYVTYGVFIGEVIAPIMLIFAKYIRIAGAIIAFNMLVAIVLVHKDTLFTLGDHGAWSVEVPILYLIMALTLTFWTKEKVRK